VVKEVVSFRGPALLSQANNFGLYVSEDLKLVNFYYKDVFKNLQLIYYTFKEETISSHRDKIERELKFACKAIPNTWLSTHSNDFRYYLKQNREE
jgi:hypothetical protein